MSPGWAFDAETSFCVLSEGGRYRGGNLIQCGPALSEEL